MENLVLGFPELVSRMQILSQYFMYEVISNRIRVFPLLAYDAAGLTDCLVGNEQQALVGYDEALKQLEVEGKISQNERLHGSSLKSFGFNAKNPKIRLLNFAKNGPRTLFTSLFGVLPQLMTIVSQNTEEFLRTQKLNWKRQLQPGCAFVDPQKYVFFPTEEGLLSLADKIDIKGFVTKMSLMEPEQQHSGKTCWRRTKRRLPDLSRQETAMQRRFWLNVSRIGQGSNGSRLHCGLLGRGRLLFQGRRDLQRNTLPTNFYVAKVSMSLKFCM